MKFKKILTVSIVTLAISAAGLTNALAGSSIQDSGNHYSKTSFTVEEKGTQSLFSASAGPKTETTSMYSTINAKRFFVVSVERYNINGRLEVKNKNDGYNSGSPTTRVFAGISRQPYTTKKFIHIGKCYEDDTKSTLVDDYKYTNNQKF